MIATAEEFFGFISGEIAYPPDFVHRKAIEFAKQQAIGFMDWRNDVKKFDKNILRNNPDITNEELYEEYLKH